MNTPAPDPFDRALAAYSAREQALRIDPPAGFAERATAAVLGRPRWPRWATGASAFVGLVLAVGVGYAVWPKAEPPAPVQPAVVTPAPEQPPPKIGDTLSEAGEALAKLGRDTTEKATPPRALLGTVEPLKLPPKAAPPDVQPAAETLAAVPGAARSGLEPVTGSTRRAINLFLRDTGLKPN